MAKPHLEVITGELPRGARKPRMSLEDTIVRRWRADAQHAHESSGDEGRDVIPLLDGWLRRLERQSESPTDKRP